MSRRLCALEDIPANGCKELPDSGDPSLFAVRRNGELYLYRNRCPHAGTPLNWMPDRFLSRDGNHLQCSTHGALFTIEDGLCIAGPCPGKSLVAVPFTILGGDVWLAETASNH